MFHPSGSLKQNSSPVITIPPQVDVTLTDTLSDVEKIASNDYVNQTFSHKSVYNPITSLSTISSIYAYPSSTTITVTFYTKNGGEINTRTADTDFALSINLTQNYIKVINFEFRLSSSGMVPSFNEETNVSSYTGTGYIYPKFDVRIGDVFLYEIDAGNLGLFKITNKKPLSIHRDTLHEVEFELILFPTADQLKELNSYVDRTAYFFKDTFFNGEVGLIYDETYQLLTLIHQKKELLFNYYLDKFYEDVSLKTIIRPDGVYDPYIIEFLFSFINFTNGFYYPKRLLTEYVNKNKNIYSYLFNPSQYIKKIIPNSSRVAVKEFNHRDTDINGLINRSYIVLEQSNDLTVPYILDNFVQDNKQDFTVLETILYQYETERIITPNVLITFIGGFLSWSDMDQFYNIPICLFLLAITEGILLK